MNDREEQMRCLVNAEYYWVKLNEEMAADPGVTLWEICQWDGDYFMQMGTSERLGLQSVTEIGGVIMPPDVGED